MKKFLTIASLLTVIATPAFAATTHHHAAQSLRHLYMSAPDAGRDAALLECNAKAQQFSMMSWQDSQSAAYATCMSEHGQVP